MKLENMYVKVYTETARLTPNVETNVLIVDVLRPDCHLHPTSCLLHLLATGLGHHLMAAMVDIDSTIGALLPLLHQPVDEGATVIAPRGVTE